jgi:hypothetical protein
VMGKRRQSLLYSGNKLYLRHYDKSQKVAVSIPDEVIGFFDLPNPFSATIALGSIQPLTEMSITNLPGG